MLNKDKRSLFLCTLIGDGCLHIDNRGYGRYNIVHGVTQSDYQTWKAQLLSEVFSKPLKLYSGHKGKSIQIQMCMKRFRAWYKIFYKNKIKDIPKILKFIRHPELALILLLMDDGYAEPSFSKLATGEKKLYGARFRIFLCDQTETQLIDIIAWLKHNFQIEAKIQYQLSSKQNKRYPFLKINQKDSLRIWKLIRVFVLRFKSMKYKFRHIESTYQSRNLQPQPNES